MLAPIRPLEGLNFFASQPVGIAVLTLVSKVVSSFTA